MPRLAGDYAAAVRRAVRSAAAEPSVLVIAELPEMVRGFESIKERNIAAYQARLSELLARLDSSA